MITAKLPQKTRCTEKVSALRSAAAAAAGFSEPSINETEAMFRDGGTITACTVFPIKHERTALRRRSSRVPVQGVRAAQRKWGMQEKDKSSCVSIVRSPTMCSPGCCHASLLRRAEHGGDARQESLLPMNCLHSDSINQPMLRTFLSTCRLQD
uniref:Uncharacterized protein n=1 Tax=Setaria digitata TaxID=48799 RepID=A0A915Q5E7_9BILA